MILPIINLSNSQHCPIYGYLNLHNEDGKRDLSKNLGKASTLQKQEGSF